jgi:hypothetical protein
MGHKGSKEGTHWVVAGEHRQDLAVKLCNQHKPGHPLIVDFSVYPSPHWPSSNRPTEGEEEEEEVATTSQHPSWTWTDEASPFSAFPTEMKMAIFGWLDVANLIRASFVCKEWNSLISDESIWKAVAEKEMSVGHYVGTAHAIEAMGWRSYALLAASMRYQAWDPRTAYGVRVGEDGLTLMATCKGRVGWNDDVGYVRLPVNLALGTQVKYFYFEVKMLQQGWGEIICGVGIGFYPSTKPGHEEIPKGMVGWYDNSIGWHADDGKVRAGTWGSMMKTCATAQEAMWYRNDIAGCGYHNGVIFFTKNGKRFGDAFQDIFGTYYPCLTFVTQGLQIVTNFGRWPFRYNHAAYIAQRDLNSTKSPLSPESPAQDPASAFGEIF